MNGTQHLVLDCVGFFDSRIEQPCQLIASSSFCFETALPTSQLSWLIAFEENTAATRYANLKRIVEAGIRTPTGTDTFCGFGKFGEIAHIEIEHYERAGIPPLRVLKMATSEAAQHLDASDLGSIAPGKLADMTLVDGDPASNISALRRVSTVIKNGAIVSAKGKTGCS